MSEASSRKSDDVIHSAAMGHSLKILERMVNQNAEDEIYQDFKYWEVCQQDRAAACAQLLRCSAMYLPRTLAISSALVMARCCPCGALPTRAPGASK